MAKPKTAHTKTIRLPETLWKRLKVASAEHDIKIQDLVADALESKLHDMRGGIVPDKSIVMPRASVTSESKEF